MPVTQFLDALALAPYIEVVENGAATRELTRTSATKWVGSRGGRCPGRVGRNRL